MGFPAVAFLQTCLSYFPCVYLLICGPGRGHIFRAKLCLLFSLLEDSAVANIVDKQGEQWMEIPINWSTRWKQSPV